MSIINAVLMGIGAAILAGLVVAGENIFQKFFGNCK